MPTASESRGHRTRQRFTKLIVIQYPLKYNAYQPVTAVVYDLFHRLPYLQPSLLGHTVELVVQPLVNEVADRLAEDIAVPYL